ncbi:DNA topoisomerase-3 [Ruminococcus albus]|uniref:DNA topoisomerase n=1 Tax=Ruminococcus albus TaxID=1264 RepID=A0A1I1CW09_RUMAL|nr:DNA topoisomerase-3 [Ruminococcus albus]
MILCEKPSVALATAYCVGATDKVSDGKRFYWQGNGYIVTNALGHLVGIGVPEDYGYKKWSLADLPMIPDFKLFALNGYGSQIKMLKELMNRDDVTEIINACDAGREGECIFRYIYDFVGCKKPVKRLWISSLTDDAIREGMNNLLDSSELDNMFAAGFARAKSDWLFGINLSRYFSLISGQHHKSGRVKNAVLNIIAEREAQIAAFEKKPYFKVVLDNGAECARTFDSREEAEAVAGKCNGKNAVVSFVVAEEKKENRPLLHSLTSLQREANEVYGMTAATTLKAAQSLYEKKLLTYPRTDSNCISEDMKPLVTSIVKCLSGYDKARIDKLLAQGLNLDKRVVNNSKITDHHAIVPTNLIGRLKDTELSEPEKKVVGLVIERFLSALDKPYTYLETRYEFEVEGEIFKLTTKKPIELGWRQYTNMKDEPVYQYAEGETVFIGNAEVRDCETKPPAHFTEASLLAVMENIDRRIDDKELKSYVKERGLGTPATRAQIIEGLISAKYIERKKKLLLITDFGRKYNSALPENIKSAELTAHWEQMLADIEQGKCGEEDFMNEIIKNVNDVIANDEVAIEPAEQPAEIGKCPWCGSPIKEGPKAFYCSNGEDCDFFIYKHDKRIGRNYKASEISELLANGKVTLRNCTSSKGNKYAAVFELDDSGDYVNLKFVEYAKTRRRKSKEE